MRFGAGTQAGGEEGGVEAGSPRSTTVQAAEGGVESGVREGGGSRQTTALGGGGVRSRERQGRRRTAVVSRKLLLPKVLRTAASPACRGYTVHREAGRGVSPCCACSSAVQGVAEWRGRHVSLLVFLFCCISIGIDYCKLGNSTFRHAS